MTDSNDVNSVFAELPGTETTVLYDPDRTSLYIKLKPDLPGGSGVETQALIANPQVNVDLYLGEAVGIEIILGRGKEEQPSE